jgi:hypothetical protein
MTAGKLAEDRFLPAAPERGGELPLEVNLNRSLSVLHA